MIDTTFHALSRVPLKPDISNYYYHYYFFQKFENEVRKQVAEVLIESEVFDKFLGTRFPTLKRYGLEGAEGMLAFFIELFKQNSSREALILAMTHRGRLNLLTGPLRVPPALVFRYVIKFME